MDRNTIAWRSVQLSERQATSNKQKEDTMKTKEAINILNHAVEYFDMMYDSGDKRHNEEEKSNAWKALDYVANKLNRKEKHDN